MKEDPIANLNLWERIGKFLLDGAGEFFPAIPEWECLAPDAPSTAVLLDVPGVCQVSTYTCGITSTWSILRALGSRMTLKQWYWRCHRAGCHPNEGMDIDQIAAALKTLRMKVKTRKYRSRRQVGRLIDSGQPILFGQGGETFEGGDHWMFVYGYSARHVYVGNVVSMLPVSSKEAWSWKRFEAELNPWELYLINS